MNLIALCNRVLAPVAGVFSLGVEAICTLAIEKINSDFMVEVREEVARCERTAAVCEEMLASAEENPAISGRDILLCRQKQTKAQYNAQASRALFHVLNRRISMIDGRPILIGACRTIGLVAIVCGLLALIRVRTSGPHIEIEVVTQEEYAQFLRDNNTY